MDYACVTGYCKEIWVNYNRGSLLAFAQWLLRMSWKAFAESQLQMLHVMGGGGGSNMVGVVEKCAKVNNANQELCLEEGCRLLAVCPTDLGMDIRKL